MKIKALLYGGAGVDLVLEDDTVVTIDCADWNIGPTKHAITGDVHTVLQLKAKFVNIEVKPKEEF